MSESWWERFGTKRDTVDVQEGVELKEQLKKKKKGAVFSEAEADEASAQVTG